MNTTSMIISDQPEKRGAYEPHFGAEIRPNTKTQGFYPSAEIPPILKGRSSKRPNGENKKAGERSPLPCSKTGETPLPLTSIEERWLRQSEVLQLLNIGPKYPDILRSGIKKRRWPKPQIAELRAKRWAFSEIAKCVRENNVFQGSTYRRSLTESLAILTAFAAGETRDEIAARRKWRRERKDRLAREISSAGNDAKGCRAEANALLEILMEHFSPENSRFITMCPAAGIFAEGQLHTFCVRRFKSAIKRIFKRMGLERRRVAGAIDICLIRNFQEKAKGRFEWNVHAHLVVDVKGLTKAQRRKAAPLLDQRGKKARPLHVKEIDRWPFQTTYLFKSPAEIKLRYRNSAGGLLERHDSMKGRHFEELSGLFGRLRGRDRVCLQGLKRFQSCALLVKSGQPRRLDHQVGPLPWIRNFLDRGRSRKTRRRQIML